MRDPKEAEIPRGEGQAARLAVRRRDHREESRTHCGDGPNDVLSARWGRLRTRIRHAGSARLPAA